MISLRPYAPAGLGVNVAGRGQAKCQCSVM